jgi:hypothetical protein
LRKRPVIAASVTAGVLAFLAAAPAQSAEYSSALKVRGIQYDAPGRDSNSCSYGNTDEEYLGRDRDSGQRGNGMILKP